jgi:ketosteroid isomerase-like protein
VPPTILRVVASANLDLVRSIYADWERGDFGTAEWAHPDIEYVLADGPSPGSWTGLAGMAEAFRSWLSAWQDFHVEVDEYRELDGERVLVLVTNRGRGKTSGLELGQIWSKGVMVFHVHGGKVTRVVTYFDGDRALTELGMTSEADSSHS